MANERLLKIVSIKTKSLNFSQIMKRSYMNVGKYFEFNLSYFRYDRSIKYHTELRSESFNLKQRFNRWTFLISTKETQIIGTHQFIINTHFTVMKRISILLNSN